MILAFRFMVLDTVADPLFFTLKETISPSYTYTEDMKRNADTFNVSEDEELYRLLIHGTLHLLGGDHKTNDPTEPMLMRQEEILKRLGGVDK